VRGDRRPGHGGPISIVGTAGLWSECLCRYSPSLARKTQEVSSEFERFAVARDRAVLPQALKCRREMEEILTGDRAV
jgi:hypothetical protein